MHELQTEQKSRPIDDTSLANERKSKKRRLSVDCARKEEVKKERNSINTFRVHVWEFLFSVRINIFRKQENYVVCPGGC